MWQGLRLKTKEQNQFLGDMFEYFLDNSIKQSEGQFFTPMPITKFIVASLPLEDKIQKSSEPLRAIDYACGSGHFLTEYAHQIKPLVERYKETDISKYYENIVGIEKEDRLAKIAKVSAYMYGQDQINILEKDALSSIDEVKNESFDVLVANPPFAVEGFLLNLDDKQKQLYKLIETTELNSNTNSIQCFFIERAKQIMKPNSVVGIIVPLPILSKADATHTVTREIILKYFDIISLVELGKGTFGKTGTETVVLYLKRKSQKPEPTEHYANRVEDYFEGIKEDDKSKAEYQDLYLIQKYCEHIETPFEQYKELFAVTAETIANLDELFKTDMFATYKNNFENSTEIINYKKKKIYKDKSKEEKKLELNKRLIKYISKIEKSKLFYFILAYENKQKVLIIKSPSNSKEQKKFLGYEWSGAKGREGIKYIAGDNLNDIVTPLFNPKNLDDKSKINYLIRQNFLGAEPNDLKEFEQYKDLISYVNLTDILDFSQKDFDKNFSLSPKTNLDVEWRACDLRSFRFILDNISEKAKKEIEKSYADIKAKAKNKIRLNNSDMFKISIGRRVVTKEIAETKKGIPVYSANVFEPFGLIDKTLLKDFDSPSILWGIDGDWMVNFIEKKSPFYPTDHCGVIRVKGDEIHPRYLTWILEEAGKNVRFSRTHRASTARIKGLSIKVPPYKLQEEFVNKIEKIEQKIINAKKSI